MLMLLGEAERVGNVVDGRPDRLRIVLAVRISCRLGKSLGTS